MSLLLFARQCRFDVAPVRLRIAPQPPAARAKKGQAGGDGLDDGASSGAVRQSNSERAEGGRGERQRAVRVEEMGRAS